MAGYRTPLGQARGLGSAKDGVKRFIAGQVTSVALVFLVLWAVWSGLTLARGGYDEAIQWLASPVNATLMALLAVIGFYHMQMGMAVVIEDYISKRTTRGALLVLNALACWTGLALTVVCLLKVALLGGGR